MTHGEEEAQTKEEKEESRVPLHDTHQAVHFFVILYFREGKRNRRKQHEEDMKELCPNTTHGDKHKHKIKVKG